MVREPCLWREPGHANVIAGFSIAVRITEIDDVHRMMAPALCRFTCHVSTLERRSRLLGGTAERFYALRNQEVRIPPVFAATAAITGRSRTASLWSAAATIDDHVKTGPGAESLPQRLIQVLMTTLHHDTKGSHATRNIGRSCGSVHRARFRGLLTFALRAAAGKPTSPPSRFALRRASRSPDLPISRSPFTQTPSSLQTSTHVPRIDR